MWSSCFKPEPQRWSLFWLVLGILVGWRCVRAIVQPYSEFVQEAVRQCLVSLIVLDAAVCAAVKATTALGDCDSGG